MWAGQMTRRLNRTRLPSGYTAEVETHVGSHIEVDVGTFENVDRYLQPPSANGGGFATLKQTAWVAAEPEWAMTALFPTMFEIRVVDTERGQLVAAIELVSPSNKDQPESRASLIAKCAAYLQQGVGLVVVDVTKHHFNLHNDLARFQ